MYFPKYIFFLFKNIYALYVYVFDMRAMCVSAVLCIVLECLCAYEINAHCQEMFAGDIRNNW